VLPKIITISYIVGRYVRFRESNRFTIGSIGYMSKDDSLLGMNTDRRVGNNDVIRENLLNRRYLCS